MLQELCGTSSGKNSLSSVLGLFAGKCIFSFGTLDNNNLEVLESSLAYIIKGRAENILSPHRQGETLFWEVYILFFCILVGRISSNPSPIFKFVFNNIQRISLLYLLLNKELFI